MSRITKSARGEDCQVRIPGKCNFNPETTVFAHKNGYGVGGKNPDYMGAYCCSSCHDVVDGRDNNHPFTKEEILRYFYEGIFRTLVILFRKGLIKIVGKK